ncbi:uncharacterized protein LOC130799322 [Amaranthus tricolor]|uniref:uncharacterized protein LOC130799322 n=1 Tax=Amaranthus tricolor TaxID=29722 RepID=UPI002585FA43|nr:uncharacterized protein LOC130799322 [Amaranthus tricolor]
MLQAMSLELATEYKIQVACVQETRWKWQKESVLKGYKLWYASLGGKRSGVGILVANDILKQVVEVRRCNDRITLIKIVVRENIISIISPYMPQVGLDEEVKRGDFNGHIGKEAVNCNSVDAGFGYDVRNESGEILFEFALAKKLVIANSIFRMKDEHLITYKSGRHAMQIDYCLVRKVDLS